MLCIRLRAKIVINASYIGQTKRQLNTRLKEHKYNIKLDSNKQSVVSKHIHNFSHSFDSSNVKILDIEHNFYKRSVAEIIHIKEQRNGINLQTNSELLNSAYFKIIEELVGSY